MRPARFAPLLLAGLGLLAACGPKEVTQEEAQKALVRNSEDARRVPLDTLPVNPNISAGKTVAYMCDGDMPVTAIYGTGADGKPDVALVIQGFSITLPQTMAASGARYASDDGIEAGKGLVWWEKGGTATLADFPSGTDSFETAVVKRTCRPRK
jgi:membrane-bound inhibitor of C-type lysozyme